ncbi:MAG: glycosyltransferase family 2 protein, partial [Verrucomicrobiae bacterium]|nr:glycosyltransferase family 2 protein [Verrucomicrobiae bacterium]
MSIPVSAVIATKDRPEKLANLFRSIRAQDVSLAEVVVVDASADGRTKALCDGPEAPQSTRWMQATNAGAACQRNEGVAATTQPQVLFADDDVVLEGGCLRALWEALQSDDALGGVNAIVTNQQYHVPGRVSRAFYAWLNGSPLANYAGRCIGPGLNFLPEDRAGLPDAIPVDWVNLGATLYRREALPSPPFQAHFVGYSLSEDLALSLTVAKAWKLASARKARVFHDTGEGRRRLGVARGAAMELVNRHFIMTEVRGMRRAGDYGKLLAWELFSIASGLRSAGGWTRLPAVLVGKIRGIFQ